MSFNAESDDDGGAPVSCASHSYTHASTQTTGQSKRAQREGKPRGKSSQIGSKSLAAAAGCPVAPHVEAHLPDIIRALQRLCEPKIETPESLPKKKPVVPQASEHEPDAKKTSEHARVTSETSAPKPIHKHAQTTPKGPVKSLISGIPRAYLRSRSQNLAAKPAQRTPMRGESEASLPGMQHSAGGVSIIPQMADPRPILKHTPSTPPGVAHLPDIHRIPVYYLPVSTQGPAAMSDFQRSSAPYSNFQRFLTTAQASPAIAGSEHLSTDTPKPSRVSATMAHSGGLDEIVVLTQNEKVQIPLLAGQIAGDLLGMTDPTLPFYTPSHALLRSLSTRICASTLSHPFYISSAHSRAYFAAFHAALDAACERLGASREVSDLFAAVLGRVEGVELGQMEGRAFGAYGAAGGSAFTAGAKMCVGMPVVVTHMPNPGVPIPTGPRVSGSLGGSEGSPIGLQIRSRGKAEQGRAKQGGLLVGALSSESSALQDNKSAVGAVESAKSFFMPIAVNGEISAGGLVEDEVERKRGRKGGCKNRKRGAGAAVSIGVAVENEGENQGDGEGVILEASNSEDCEVEDENVVVGAIRSYGVRLADEYEEEHGDGKWNIS